MGAMCLVRRCFGTWVSLLRNWSRLMTGSSGIAPASSDQFLSSDAVRARHPNRSAFKLLLVSLRPRQWTKNLAAFAPLIFAKQLLNLSAVLQASLAVISF